jgi:tRNA A-37 threonylcarbamoyl transferase component Bud32
VKTIDTNKATLTWSVDGTAVTKRPSGTWAPIRSLFLNEQRVMRMLRADPPPVRVPALLPGGRRRELVTEAIDGEPLGPKFPTSLVAGDVDDVVALVDRLDAYRPRRRWFRHFEVDRRLRDADLSAAERELVCRAVAVHPARLHFAHGDVTARNVLRAASGELVLIDWEWAGLHPAGYDRAFFWFSLADLPAARDRVAQWDAPWFTLSALFVQLFHLAMWQARGADHVFPVHHETRAMLFDRVRELV